MPRYSVEYSGQWACFSSITDAFITQFCDKDDHEDWRKAEYGRAGYQPAEMCNMMTMEETVFRSSMNRDREEWIECLLETGLSGQEIEKLIFDCETKHYVPIKKEKGYECPNCGCDVLDKQKHCTEEGCEIRLVWR